MIHNHQVQLYTPTSNSFQAYNLLHYWYSVRQYSTEIINAIRQTMTYNIRPHCIFIWSATYILLEYLLSEIRYVQALNPFTKNTVE